MNTKDEPDVSHDNLNKQANAIIDVTKNFNDERRDSSNQESDNETVIEHKFSPKTTVNALSCSFCNKIFNRTTRKQELEKHERTHTGEKPFKCDLCDKYFATSSNRCDHVRKKHIGIKPHSCDICDKGFWRKDGLTMHRISAHKDRYTSTEIDEIKESVGLKNHHNKKHSLVKLEEEKLKTIPCYWCPKKFETNPLLKKHERMHTGEKPYKCDLCGKYFAQDSQLSIHKKRHTGIKPHSCDICDKGFWRKNELTMHRISAHKDRYTSTEIDEIKESLGMLSCYVCNKLFRSRYLLEIHERVHTGDKPFKCDVCEHFFAQRGHLDLHMKRHTGIKPYSCDLCGKSFLQEYYLNLHWKSHTKEKPFACEVCGKAYPINSELQKHRRIHTEEPTFACDFCEKAFYEKYALQKHISIHTGEKPFSCKFCGKAFRLRSQMTGHTKAHEKKKGFSCDLCDKVFLLQANLSKHKQNDHSIRETFSCSICKKEFDDHNKLNRHRRFHLQRKKISKKKVNDNINVIKKEEIVEVKEEPNDESDAEPSILIECKSGEGWEEDKQYVELCTTMHSEIDQLNKESNDEVNNMDVAKLSTHIIPRKPADNYQFQCQQCYNYFPRRANLNNHIARIHSTDKPFSCNICSKPFALVKQLKRHIKTHTKDTDSATKEDKKFALLSCNACDVMFADKETLDAHRLTHNRDNELINLKEEEEDDLVYATVQVPLQQNSISQNKVNNKINVIQKVEAKAEANDDSDIEDDEPSISIECEGGGREEDAEPSILMECEDGEGLEEDDEDVELATAM